MSWRWAPILLLSACAVSPAPPDATEADAFEAIDVGPEACAVDLTCPEREPNPGALCEGALSCEYGERSGCPRPWIAHCESGRWVLIEPVCDFRSRPLTGEHCNAPFTSTARGTVSVALPRDRLVIGTQGLPMLFIEVALDGEAQSLDWVATMLDLTVDGISIPPRGRTNLRLRCGSTTGYLSPILADDLDVCDGESHLALARVNVDGVGTGSASVTIVGCD